MELPWNICPFCGTPAPGMRREHLTLDEALRPLGVESEVEEIPIFETIEEQEQLPEIEEEFEQVSEGEIEQESDREIMQESNGELEQVDEVDQDEPIEE